MIWIFFYKILILNNKINYPPPEVYSNVYEHVEDEDEMKLIRLIR